MAQETTSGGSKSTDFQPVTGNPQENVSGSLQPNSANLQPITTTNGSNVFNQPGINSQAFPKTDSLQVLSTGTKSSKPNNTLSANAPKDSGFLTIFVVAVVVTVIVILAFAKMAKPIQDSKETVTEESIPTTNQPKSKKNLKNKKKKSKKRNKK